MNILAIEPYYSGSHQAYIDGWKKRSRHNIELITFPAYKWKWRMRHASLSAALRTTELLKKASEWDLLFVSDMLNLPEYLGLAPSEIMHLPKVVYFHENQLTYPDNYRQQRDMHFAYSNFLTANAADKIWFNTNWHKETFFSALESFLRKMPDFQHTETIVQLIARAVKFPQAISRPVAESNSSNTGILTLTWSARWEHDKNPEDLYRLLQLLRSHAVVFRINIIGESFTDIPQIFRQIQEEFAESINRFGYQPTRESYGECLEETDIIISTAIHEFFGISIIEGCSHGAIPLAPRRLAYPEVLENNQDFLYDNTPEELCAKILKLSIIKGSPEWRRLQNRARQLADNFFWENIIPQMDNEIEEIVNCRR